jgi:hypothetical protein
LRSSSACATDIIGPDTRPCIRRMATSMGMLVAMPQMALNTMNSRFDTTKVRTSPKRRPIQPASGCTTAAASR